MTTNKDIEIKNFFTALLIFVREDDNDFVKEELVLEYNKYLKKLSEILSYDFKNFGIGQKEIYNNKEIIKMPIDGFSSSSASSRTRNKDGGALIEKKYKKDWLILKLNHLILTMGDLNKKI
jgi:hypothetical protein